MGNKTAIHNDSAFSYSLQICPGLEFAEYERLSTRKALAHERRKTLGKFKQNNYLTL